MEVGLIKECWERQQAAIRDLNVIIRDSLHINQRIQVLWCDVWRDATVTWVPYHNSPASQQHIYAKIDGHKSSRKFEMGGGIFSTVRVA